MPRTCANGSSCARPRAPPSSTRSRSASPLPSRRKRWKACAASTTRGTPSGSGRRGKGSGGSASLLPPTEIVSQADPILSRYTRRVRAEVRPRYGITPRPEWLKVRLYDNATSRSIASLIEDKHLNTVCQEARCPNIFECWGVDRTATFMLMGDVCTRHCGFCAVAQGAGKPLDPEEPHHVAEAVQTLGVRHAVVTSVNRDELPDGGAAHFAATIREIRALAPGVTIEVLIPDLLGSEAALGTVLYARPRCREGPG